MFKHTLIAALVCASLPALAQEKKKEKEFTMDGEFGLIVTTGNTETASVTGGITARQNLDKWQNDYLIEGLYRQESVETDGIEETRASAQQFFASAQGNYKLKNPDHRLFVFSSYEDDRFGGFRYQATVAGGWNQKLWSNETTAFEYSIGPGYAFQEEQDGTDASSLILRSSANFNWFISDTAKFTQNVATEGGADNTKTRAETALTAQINGSLSMKLSFQLDHNTQVPSDREKLDTETAVTLVYSFF
jgi:putative salt-induced outer membrane protein YdiY